jgi:hypothetical protein
MEIYREPLTQDPVWTTCASEWGRGPGFKNRVEEHLHTWFNNTRPDLKESHLRNVGERPRENEQYHMASRACRHCPVSTELFRPALSAV